ncbi:SRPBCC family protein [Sphingorhabdus lutea]|nr:SRPBCC family protein [Sphingorhabdus lutea]
MFALFAIVPTIQILAVLIIAFFPKSAQSNNDAALDDINLNGEKNKKDILIGILSGGTIIVMSVVVSALTFGAYGWGLFVATPLIVGATTAYISNRNAALSQSQTNKYVLAASMLGTLALLMLALEGFYCILLIAPLAMIMAIIGGFMGRRIAIAKNGRSSTLSSIAMLPFIFAIEAAMPPELTINASEEIIISASPNIVWDALTSNKPINISPGIVGAAGLAYPLKSELKAKKEGGERIGVFSTGMAREIITVWQAEQRLEFKVLEQPPAMEEMSPYRKVHAPHLSGYFDTGKTEFSLTSMPNNRTKLTVRSTHILRIDPILYWEPVASWAIGQNMKRVLLSIKNEAENRKSKIISAASYRNSAG